MTGWTPDPSGITLQRFNHTKLSRRVRLSASFRKGDHYSTAGAVITSLVSTRGSYSRADIVLILAAEGSHTLIAVFDAGLPDALACLKCKLG